MLSQLMGWFGACSGIGGAVLLSLNVARVSRWAWPVWVGSNVAWIAYALYERNVPLLLQNAVFLATSLMGLVRWWGIRLPRRTTSAFSGESDVQEETA